MKSEFREQVTVVFTEKRLIERLDALVEIDHSSRAAVLRKAVETLANQAGV